MIISRPQKRLSFALTLFLLATGVGCSGGDTCGKGDADYYEALSDQNLTDSDFEAALDNLNCAIELSPENAFLYHMRAYALSSLGDDEAALVDAERQVELAPDSYVAHTDLGIYLLRTGDLDKALDSLNKSIEIKPDDSMAYYYRAALFDEQKLGVMALQDYQQFLELTTMDNYLTDHARKRIEELQPLTNALSPADPYIQEGLALADAGDFEAAMDSFWQATEADPNHPFPYYAMGFVYYHYMDDLDNALIAFTTAIDMYPTEWTFYAARGSVYYDLGDDDEALLDLETAIALAPADADPQLVVETLYNRALVYDSLGKIDEAIRDYQDVLRLSSELNLTEPVGQEYARERIEALGGELPD